jgi:hypothetical protein
MGKSQDNQAGIVSIPTVGAIANYINLLLTLTTI